MVKRMSEEEILELEDLEDWSGGFVCWPKGDGTDSISSTAFEELKCRIVMKIEGCSYSQAKKLAADRLEVQRAKEAAEKTSNHKW